uniref:NADH dehydrogenase [ubiquinone] flavoprotein 3, mitochondrial n=1 Tax=Geotrypetes seraphini TaxID=260995 RepID=A0A6P8R7Y6_GEOSA|nr:NADH dehydrogenase [ubiquinone] flavoprotein 3, mitochondrial [Geotrypetes seraphini]
MAVSLLWRTGWVKLSKVLQLEELGLQVLPTSRLLCTKSEHPKKEPTKNIIAPEDQAKHLAAKTSIEFPTKLSSKTKDEAISISNLNKPIKVTDEETGMFRPKKSVIEFPRRAAISQDNGSAIPMMTGNKSSKKHTVGEGKKEFSSSSSDSDSESDSDSKSDSEEKISTMEINVKKTKVEFPIHQPFFSLKNNNENKLAMYMVDEDLKLMQEDSTNQTSHATHKNAPADIEIMKPDPLSRQKETWLQMEGKNKLTEVIAKPSVVATVVTQVTSPSMAIKGTQVWRDVPNADEKGGNKHLFVHKEESFEDSASVINPEITREISQEVASLKEEDNITEAVAVQWENGIGQAAAVEINSPSTTESSAFEREALGTTESSAIEREALGTTEGLAIEREAHSTTESIVLQVEEQSTIQESAEQESDNSTYKNLQHHNYTLYTFVDFDVQLEKLRQPQPSSERSSPQH